MKSKLLVHVPTNRRKLDENPASAGFFFVMTTRNPMALR
ncbi:hypothetical protein CPter91_4606 [Collimonas pratensis]|uniref:Uncharacterized protein n=1 Tax=Collimonas pratensis TaxID=279113 RepID=A0A127QBB7_9BURK|nr:hypothetical protein CPter91_4606 [Collimonas pratensis]